VKWPSKLAGAAIAAGLIWAIASHGSAARQTAADPVPARPQLFHPDPEHLWNRLHYHLTVASGQEGSFDALDPVLWPQTEWLLTGASHEKALRLLDEFLRARGERLVSDPLKRALLQRDIWAVFDWAARKDPHPEARRALRAKLAPVLWRLALQEEQVNVLPDTYRQAVASGRYAVQYDPSHPKKPFLPPDLFDPQGPWVALRPARYPIAPTHVSAFSGRSVFHIFLRLPGGRKATMDYLAKLWHFPRPWVPAPDLRTSCCLSLLNPDVPQFPPGTQVALVRRMVLFDADGKLLTTPMTESVQIRVFRDVPTGGLTAASMRAQDFFEFNLSRALLLAGEAGGLRQVRIDEEVKFSIFGNGHLTCVNCHAGPGVHSFNSVEALFPPSPLVSDSAEAYWHLGPPDASWKEDRYDWGLLNALRPLPDNPPEAGLTPR